MNKENMAEYLETVPKPVPANPPNQKILKMSLLTARRSSRIGIWLVASPGIVLLLFFIQNLLHLRPGLTQWLSHSMPSLSAPFRAVLIFIFLVGFPLVAVTLNLLSLCHFQYDRIKQEFHITFKMRWWNIVLTIVGGALASFYILHLLADTLLGGAVI
jgi:hypothetical protein